MGEAAENVPGDCRLTAARSRRKSVAGENGNLEGGVQDEARNLFS